MKCVNMLPLAILFAATCAIGQKTVVDGASNSASLTLPRAYPASCPVGLQAEHGTFSVERKASNGRGVGPGSGADRAPALHQRIHLTMKNLLSREIVSAELTVHGLSYQSRLVTLSDASPAPDLAKTVSLVLALKADSDASRDLWLSRFAAVTAIDLKALTYADGSTWHASSSGACSVSPNLLMRADAGR
jgi:hypothetical protein